MFQPVVDAATVARANTLPLEGLQNSIQQGIQHAEQLRKERMALAKQAQADKWRSIQDINDAFDHDNVATGTVLDPLVNAQLAQAREKYTGDILSGQDPNMVSALGHRYVGQMRLKQNAALSARQEIEKRTQAEITAHPELNYNSLLADRLKTTFANPDGTANLNFNTEAVQPLDYNNPAAILPHLNGDYLDKTLPGTLSGIFPAQTISHNAVDAQGRPYSQALTMGGDQTFDGQNFKTLSEPYQIPGTNATIPLYPEELYNRLNGNGLARVAIYKKMVDTKNQIYQQYGKEQGDKILQSIGPDALARNAGYNVASQYGIKGAKTGDPNYKQYELSRQEQNDAFTHGMETKRYNLAVDAAARAAEKDPDGLSGYKNQAGKRLTNKEVKETKQALTSVPGMWLSALGGNGPQAQAEAIAHLPDPVDIGGQQWFPLTAQVSPKGDYLTDPKNQAPVQAYFDPIKKRIAVLPMQQDEEIDHATLKPKKLDTWHPVITRATYYTDKQYRDFMHTYGPQAMKATQEVKYDLLAPIVNHAFGQ